MSYQKLEAHFKKLHHLGDVLEILQWDQAVIMPLGAGSARAESLATLEVLRHQLAVAPEQEDWFGAAAEEREQGQLSEDQEGNLREMHRQWIRAACVPDRLVEASARADSLCEQAWRDLRPKNDFAGLLPKLEEVFSLKRELAQIWGEQLGLTPYDALLDAHEPGVTSREIDTLFDDLKQFLPGFLQQVLERQARQQLAVPRGPFPRSAQKELGLRLMRAIGFDATRGRLDTSHHPFCGGVPDDVRITTRYDEGDFMSSLMGVLHEAGHGKYEQGLPQRWRGQPAGMARGMGTHEGQSLLQEMQISRGRPFLAFAAPIIREVFAEQTQTQLAAFEAENLYRLYTRVQPGLIRVDADEVTYPSHVIVRYELERRLFQGTLLLRDVPEAWDQLMRQLLGVSTLGNDRDGCLQDVHWPSGAFGYFPVYTLGAMQAAQLYGAASRAIGDLEVRISAGDFEPLNRWLEEWVWSRGSLVTARELLVEATGEPLNPDYFKSHLTARYLES